MASAIIARDHVPEEAAAFRARVAAKAPGLPKLRVFGSARHTLETNYFDYRKALLAGIKRFRRARRTVIEHRGEPAVQVETEQRLMAAE